MDRLLQYVRCINVTHDGWIAATLGDTDHSMTSIVIRMRMQKLILLCGKKKDLSLFSGLAF